MKTGWRQAHQTQKDAEKFLGWCQGQVSGVGQIRGCLWKQPDFLRVPWVLKAPWRSEVGTVGLGDGTSSYRYCQEVCVFPLLKVLKIFYCWVWHHNWIEEAVAKKRPPLSTWETLSGNVMKSGENRYLLTLFRKPLAQEGYSLNQLLCLIFKAFYFVFPLSHKRCPIAILNGFFSATRWHCNTLDNNERPWQTIFSF